MNSWWSPNNAGDEPASSPYSSSGWPTPRTTPANPSPRRREHALQPPPLTTSLGGHQFQGLGVALGPGHVSTPLSTTSLSSPFTQSPAVNSSGGPGPGSSPMISRQYNVPYNPQDWGPVNNGSSRSAGQSAYPPTSNVLRIVPHHRSSGSHSDMNLSPPPPPYSPPHTADQANQHAAPVDSGTPNTGSPYTGAVRSAVDTPIDYQHTIPRTRRAPSTSQGDASHSRQISLPPPPPLPQGIPTSRSSSHNRVDVYRDQTSFSPETPYVTVSQDIPHSPQPNGYNYAPIIPQRDDSLPPASRRAVSAGPIVGSAGTSRATSQSRGQSPQAPAWGPGMPLPPPPPGPPPTARSQSASGLADPSSLRSSQSSARAGTRQPPALGTSLGSIPPTPADWVDEGHVDTAQRRDRTPLNIDTSSPVLSRDTLGSGSTETAHTSRNSISNGLFRSPAVRDSSAKGIRERRTERRNRQSQVFDDYSAVSTNTNPWADALEQVKPSNLVLDDQNHAESHAESSRHDSSSSSVFTPRTTHSMGSDGQRTASRSRASSGGLFSSRSSYSTPRAEPSPLGPATRGYAQTPPFSPGTEKQSTLPKGSSQQALPPKALPTPPLQTGQDSRPPSGLGSREERPLSHILHTPNDLLNNPPLQPRRLSDHQRPSLDSVVKQDTELVQAATRRHREFIEKEASAVDEAEALRLFTEFVITESQIRRERYAKLWDSGSFEIEQVRRRLFELPPKPVPQPQAASRSLRVAPRLDIPRGESAWNNYKPCLSPIQSLNMSNDEMSSRGRAPSRWWESKTGSGSEGGERRVQRSKRESKYMGLPLEALQSAQNRSSAEGSGVDPSISSDSQYAAYGPDEYPPEKVGWHEEAALPDYTSSTSINRHGSSREMRKMDVSRLITLPPPYPRHYPAVNNSHPELVSYRTLVRSISDLTEIKSTRERHLSEAERLLQEHKERVREGRRQFKSNIQSQIQDGSISFGEAAEAEAALIEDEYKQERELTKRVLDTYQESVMTPMKAILNDRIERATVCIDELRSKLFDDAQHETPDQTQEEGDEKPELLEKLTQLKWLFEAREQLHREMYDIISDRDEKYKAVVVLPYKQKNVEEKVRETTAFFVRDALDRRVGYESSALARLESFLDVIEENVVRGVEMQLSAFWDIAPSLFTLVQQLPENLNGFQVRIPANEYEENPSYHQHPLQYLYTLVSHAEKSSYQYIESQINLFCLLHEVKSAVMKTNCKLTEADRIRQGEPEEKVKREMQGSQADEERTLTHDLKDKVGTVEGQWTEALGSQIQSLRERVREQLERENGWEDLEQLEQA